MGYRKSFNNNLINHFLVNTSVLYGEKYGLGIILAGGNAGIGRYETI
jgi:hypothetical protein